MTTATSEPNSTILVTNNDDADSPGPVGMTRGTASFGSCCNWFRSEVCCSCFGCCWTQEVDNQLTTWFGPVDAANGQRLDWKRSFQLQASSIVILMKFFLWGLIVASFTADWVKIEHPEFFMAYLTRWTAFHAIAYLTLSLALSVGFLSCCGSSLQGQSAPWSIRLTWLAYSVATTHGLGVLLLFWLMEYDPDRYDITYFTIWPHSISFAFVVIDGYLINRVPVRLCHYWVSAFLAILWVIWSVVQAVVPVENPYIEDVPGEDQDYIYSILDWNEDPGAAVVITVITVFVAFPIFTLLFWGLSLIGRRYETVEEEGEKDKAAASVDGDKDAAVQIEEADDQETQTQTEGDHEDHT